MALAAEARIGVQLRHRDVQRRQPVGVVAALHVALEHAGAHAVEPAEDALEQRRLAGARGAHQVDHRHRFAVEVVAVGAGDRVVGVERVLDDSDLRPVHLHPLYLEVALDLGPLPGHSGRQRTGDAEQQHPLRVHVISSITRDSTIRTASPTAARTGALNSATTSSSSPVIRVAGSQPTTSTRGSGPPRLRASASTVTGSIPCASNPTSAASRAGSITYSVPGAPPRGTASTRIATS